jgi:WD40 repeat protein
VFPDGGNVLALIETDEAGDVVTEAKQIAVAPGDRLVSLGASGEVTVLQSMPGGQVSVASPASPGKAGADPKAVLSSNGQRIAMLGEQPDEVIVTNPLEAGSPGLELKGDRAVIALAFDSAGGRFLATADASAITVRPVDGGATPARRIPLASETTIGAMAVHPDGTRVAAYSPAGTAYVWDVMSGEQLTLPMQGVRALAFSPDGKWISVSTSTEIRIWDVEHSHESPVVLPASTDGRDGRYLAAPRISEGYTRTSVWRVDTGELVGEVGGFASDVAFLSDSKRLAVAMPVADAEAGLFITDFDPVTPDTICRVVGRKLTAEEWGQYAAGLSYESAC